MNTVDDGLQFGTSVLDTVGEFLKRDPEAYAYADEYDIYEW